MNTAPHQYGTDFFQDQMEGSLRSARQCVPVIQSLVQARSVVDIGCGVGTWLSAFLEQGVQDVLGLDGSYVDKTLLKVPRDRFQEIDLSQAFSQDRKFDLAVSLEVAEHLPLASAERFITSLTGLSDLVVFSAAIPGQGGTFHINEQWPGFWRDMFAAHGHVLLDCFRERFWDNELIGGAYRQNMFLFASRDGLQRNPLLQSESDRRTLPLNIVHPAVFQHALNRKPSLRPLIRALPGAAGRAIRSRLPRRSQENT